MAKAKSVNNRPKRPAIKQTQEPTIMASSFGSEEFSKAYDQCASGELADAYRSYSYDCDGEIPATIIKQRCEHFRQHLRSDEVAIKMINNPVVDALANWRDSQYDWEKSLGADIVVQKAAKFSRTYGCSVVLPILKNSEGRIIPAGQSLESAINSGATIVDKLIFSKETLKFEDEIETDFYKPWFGFPKRIKFGERTVHPSRVAFFGDIVDPFFMAIQGDLASYHESLRRLAIAVRRNSGIILKSDFAKISTFLAARKEAGAPAPDLKEITTARARSLYENINDVNAAVINDSEEVSFYNQTNIADLIKNVELQQQILSGLGSMPISKLFSKIQSTGMGNTSDTEFLNYGQDLDSWRIDFINPGLAQLDLIMSTVTKEESRDWSWNQTKAEELRLKMKDDNSQLPETPEGSP